MEGSVVKAGFDIGSGSIKIVVAEVDSETKKYISRILYEDERETLTKYDAQRNDNAVSAQMEEKLKSIINEFKAVAVKHGAIIFVGAATAVFRTTKNGREVVERLAKATGVSLVVVSQHEEAMLGFWTGAAASKESPEKLCVWDSGGASFQLSTHPKSAFPNGFYGDWGSVNSGAELLRIQGRDATLSPNPASQQEMDELRTKGLSMLPSEPGFAEALASKKLRFIAIGGVTSVFRMLEIATGTKMLTLGSARKAIETLVDKSDEEILKVSSKYVQVPLLMPKLALFCAVMEHLKLPEDLPVEFFYCTGSCPGIIYSY